MTVHDNEVNMQTTNFLPVLLGNDMNVYGMARAFHEAYGIRSLLVARAPSGDIYGGRIFTFLAVPKFNEKEPFLAALDRLYRERGGDQKLLLIASTDHYVRLIAENREALAGKFVLPYADKAVLDRLILKEDFYRCCDEYGLDYAATFVHAPETGYDFVLDFSFPVVVKASDTVDFHAHKFEGWKKVFFPRDREELEQTLRSIYEAGYRGHLIIQDMIPGEDDCIYDLQVYVGSDHKVKLMSMGNVVLEEHGASMVGNNAATLVEPHEEVMRKVQALLEGIGAEGLFDADIKYDRRDHTFKALEINIRQGRSHYRVTGGGDNLMQLVVDDYIEHKDIPGPKYATEEYFWHNVPMNIVYKYVEDEEKLAVIRRLVREGKACTTLRYPADMSLRRRLRMKVRDVNFARKYQQSDYPIK